MESTCYLKSAEETISLLKSSNEGLSENEAKSRLSSFGQNVLKAEKKISSLKIFLGQFNDFIIMIMFAAVLISAAIGEYVDAIVIAVILFLNAMLGFFQEYKAERSIEALKKLASQKAVVIREGKRTEIDASLLVPGDIVLIEEGNVIPADARLIDAIALEIQEASLTGESMPVRKNAFPIKKESIIGDRKNMLYSTTIVTRGRGRAIVTATGMHTEIGKIAKIISGEGEELTPLQKKLKRLGVFIGFLVISVCIAVFISQIIKSPQMISSIKSLDLSIFQNKMFIEIFLMAVSLAVAALPEGLPAVVTISLALGVQRMVKRNALIRKLPAVETLGCINVICTDKTGTLTCNEMTVKRIFVDEKFVEVEGEGYSTKGVFSSEPRDIIPLLKIGALCNNASIDGGLIGDPTEIALLVSAAKHGFSKKQLEEELLRVNEIPFESERKLMTTIHASVQGGKSKGKVFSYVKGAPDVIIRRCNYILISGKIRRMSEKDRKEIIDANEKFASGALRVLGFAFREFHGKETKENIEKNAENSLVFVGLQAMIDPPREEVKEAIEKCRTADIRVIMITGDHKTTAIAIAKELGINGKVLTGDEIDRIESLDSVINDVSIYARVSPEHKLKIVAALRNKGYNVAMTGDGVNDAPALKKADIGIAMGITGTDVSKEASDMILTDDNFASIVNAVEEGRIIYDNIKKFVAYLLSSNLGEVLTIFTAILLNLPLPLIAIQILWINLATDGLPALA
ncbi:MAG: HAD-IC family P-type ATPase, partial [Candidatus Woesearchaeota archaeon]|nr:HAD-IC family P-type ATPase [Candidatus Woesearchaeota archaeon]